MRNKNASETTISPSPMKIYARVANPSVVIPVTGLVSRPAGVRRKSLMMYATSITARIFASVDRFIFHGSLSSRL